MAVRILLADDHRIMREGLRALIEQEEGMEVIGEAENGRDCVETFKNLRPDIVVMDITMPELNGFEATHRILEVDPRAKILALSMHADRGYVTRMLEAGVTGYLLKDCATDEIVTAIESLMGDQVYLSPKIASAVVDGYLAGGKGSDVTSEQLTAREREVLQLLAEGYASKEIGRELDISSKTVDAHRRNIMNKLEVYTVAELTKYAIRAGLTSVGD